MKNKLKLVVAALGSLSVVIVAAFCLAMGTPDGQGPYFQGIGLTNTWTWNPSNMAPQISYFGSNYVGINAIMVTTNPIAAGSNRWTFINGILVATN